jgi:hypothetical protein
MDAGKKAGSTGRHQRLGAIGPAPRSRSSCFTLSKNRSELPLISFGDGEEGLERSAQPANHTLPITTATAMIDTPLPLIRILAYLLAW